MALIIGIVGGSGAGKTYLSQALKNYFGDQLSILSYDSYCISDPRLSEEERSKINYDQPSSYDGPLLAEHLKMLSNGRDIEVPTYDFSTHERTKITKLFKPNKIIIVEGIMSFQVKEALPFYNIKIYVEASSDRRLARRIKRDIVERGRDLNSVIDQYFATVRPMHFKYIEPCKHLADIFYNNDVDEGINKQSFSEIIKLINKSL